MPKFNDIKNSIDKNYRLRKLLVNYFTENQVLYFLANTYTIKKKNQKLIKLQKQGYSPIVIDFFKRVSGLIVKCDVTVETNEL